MDNEAQIRIRRTGFARNNMRGVVVAAGLAALSLPLLWFSLRPYTQILVFAGLCAVAAAVAGLSLWLLRRQQQWSIELHHLVLLLLLGVLPLLLPETLVTVAIADAVTIMSAYLCLGGRRGPVWLAAFVLTFTGSAVVSLRWPGLFPFDPLPAEPTGLVILGLNTFALLVAGIIVGQITTIQEAQFVELQQALQEIETRAQREQEQRLQLEQANQEIETRAATEQGQREYLQAVVERIREAAGNLSAASGQILAATTEQASGASQQSAAINQASVTIDQVRTFAEQTAGWAQGVAELAQRITEISRSGLASVANTIAGMEQVRGKVETIAANILALSEQSQAVGEIVASVKGLATKSNLLALNAAVEAARAGESGTGFSVVASEMRNLAEQSRAATVQVGEILAEIQRSVNTTVMATEDGVKGADAGMKLAADAGMSIQDLATRVGESTEAAAQITTAARQQLTGMEQISLAIKSIAQVTVQSEVAAQQTERAALNLDVLAEELYSLVPEQGMGRVPTARAPNRQRT